MSKPPAALALLVPIAVACCDGTITGIGRVPRPPETPLPAAPVESATPRGSASAAPGAGADEESQSIVAQHLLVMYAGSKTAPARIKRSRDEARSRAQEALDLVKKGQDFDKVVAAYTDEPGGAARHGDLGRFTRDKMIKAFSDAAFALDVNQVSTVIETSFGFHVIRRTQ